MTPRTILATMRGGSVVFAVTTTRYLVKDLSIPPASSVELIQGGAKVVLQNSDILKGIAGTANSIDVWCSVVDAISA